MNFPFFKRPTLIVSRLAVFAASLLFGLPGFGQPKMPAKGVKPKVADFARPAEVGSDSSVHAVVLEHVGHTKFRGNQHGWLSHETQEHRRVFVVDAQGAGEGNFSQLLRHSAKDQMQGQREELLYVNGHVWNLEDGEVKEYKLDRAAMFRGREDADYEVVRFSLPNVKAGSIVEINYTLLSPYFWALPTRRFQEKWPVRHARYTGELPGIYNYLVFRRGNHPFSVETEEVSNDVYTIRDGANSTAAGETGQLNTPVRLLNWEVKDVPPIRQEAYVSSMRNHVKSVSFQLASVNINNRMEDRLGTWPTAAKRFYQDPEFGAAIRSKNNFFKETVAEITAGLNSDSAKAASLFQYVRNEFSCDDHSAIYLSKPLRQIWNNKTGSVADVNLLLVAMLNQAGINAVPSIFATRSYGAPAHFYPIMDQYNYITAAVQLPSGWKMLDASRKHNGFGRLPMELYNGYGRLLFADNTLALPFMADSLVEQQRTAVFMGWGAGGQLELNHQVALGDVESSRLRQEVAADGREAYQKRLAKQLGFGAKINALELMQLDSLEANVIVSTRAELPSVNLDDSLVYINPILASGYAENPFKSAERYYPVEMDYPVNSSYTANINIPEGYKLEEVPKSERIRYNDGDGFFEYLIVPGADVVRLRCITKLSKATFPVEEYESLRSFFSHIVRKQQEVIVLKKIAK